MYVNIHAYAHIYIHTLGMYVHIRAYAHIYIHTLVFSIGVQDAHDWQAGRSNWRIRSMCVCPSVCECVCLLVCLSFCVYQGVHMYFASMYMSIHLSLHVYVHTFGFGCRQEVNHACMYTVCMHTIHSRDKCTTDAGSRPERRTRRKLHDKKACICIHFTIRAVGPVHSDASKYAANTLYAYASIHYMHMHHNRQISMLDNKECICMNFTTRAVESCEQLQNRS
jgi:hypothetical protein